MHRGYKYFGTMLLAAALAAPLANAKPMQDHDDHDRDEHRVYDRDHKDYHNWDAAEDRAYRGWFETRHEAYVDYNRLDAKRQNEYWKWRHEHAEHEEHEHHN
jgi:hypothetical protein